MSILITLLLLVEVITAFLLIVVILAQKSKDQGLGMAFGSGMGESLFGSRAGNVLTRMTVTLIIVFTITTVVLGILFSGGREASRSGSVMDTVDMSRQVP
ncbi:MAG: preprotein translocase subunit SecG, partial [Kiritimatiellae bacterium]|nr:preprotein translocase subunit SecG [Kiritimatiellia bacterium]